MLRQEDYQVLELARNFPKDSGLRKLTDRLYGGKKLIRTDQLDTSIFRPEVPHDSFSKMEIPPTRKPNFSRPKLSQIDRLSSDTYARNQVNQFCDKISNIRKISENEISKINALLEDIENNTKNHTTKQIVIAISASIASMYIFDALNVGGTQNNFQEAIYEVVTERDDLRIRDTPVFEGNENIVGHIRKGRLVVVVDEAGDAYKISCKKIAGLEQVENCYVSKQYLRPVADGR